MSDKPRFTMGSANIYADLGFEDPELELEKAEYARRIVGIMQARGLTPAALATAFAIDDSRVSELQSGRLGEFSKHQLRHLLVRLESNLRDADRDVEPAGTRPVFLSGSKDSGTWRIIVRPRSGADNPSVIKRAIHREIVALTN